MAFNSVIAPLCGSNYATWKLKCKMSLLKDNLWGIVSGSEKFPAINEVGAQDAYSQRRDKALAIIVLSVDPSLLYLLGDLEDPKTAWDCLQKQFQKKSWANKLNLRRKLYGLKLEEGASVRDHIKDITEIFNELAIIGDAVEEEDRVVHLLASLLESYDMLVTALEANDKVPAMETVTERLLHEERKMANKAEKEAGFMGKSRGYGKGPTCYRCGKKGHIQRNCPTKVKEKAQKASDEDNDIGLVACTSAHHALTSKTTEDWLIDSCASSHMCNNKMQFTELEAITPIDVVLGDDHVLKATGVGKVQVLSKVPDGTQSCTLHDVLYVPGLAYNLFCISKATNGGKIASFSEQDFKIMIVDQIVVTGSRFGSLYYLSLMNKQTGCAAAAIDANLWPRRYGHVGEHSLKRLASNELVTGLNLNIAKGLDFCKGCVEGKHHRSPFPKSSEEKRHAETLGLVHSDICGKMSVKSIGGAEYFLTFIDDSSRYTWVYFLKTKDEVFQKFPEWKSMIEKNLCQQVKTLRTDNGGEFTSQEFERYLRKEGIRHETTIPKTPEQNGVAERMNRTLVEMVRSMLHQMPRKFWAEALSTAVYLKNKSPATAMPNMTPYEALNGAKPDVAHLRQFGSICYTHIPKDEREKLDPKAKKCIFLGYGDHVKGYRLFDESRSRVLYSRDVQFDELG